MPEAHHELPRPRRRTVLAATAAAGLPVLASCSYGPVDDGEVSAASGETGTVTIAQGVDPTTMDPLQQRETSTANVLQHLYDPLVRRNREDPTVYEPALAEEWTQVDDTTWEFGLRQGVTFSDGTPFTAAAVKYTVDYLIGEITGDPALLSANFASLSGAEVVDDFTVRLTTSSPAPLLMPRLPGLFIVKEGAVDSDPEALAGNPIGTGPYTLEAWDRNAQVVLRAREDHFGTTPAISTVVFQTVPDAAARIAGLNAGSLDIVTNLAPDNASEVEAAGTAALAKVPSARIASVWLDTLTAGPLADPRVRLALNHAVDVQTIIDTVMGGYGTRVATFIPDYFTGHDSANEPLAYDPARARELLQQAGHGDGFDMQMMVPSGRYPFAEQVAQAIQSYVGDVGVRLSLEVVDFGVFSDATNSGNVPDSYFAAYGNSTFNPLAHFQLAVRTGDSGYALFSDPAVDDLIDEASRTTDQDAQDALVSQVEAELLEQAPFIFLYAQVDLYGVAKRVEWKPSTDESVYMIDARIV
ncbi:ABC transporter substrate-binding protein [Kineococcus sp. SYSU DK003]|uniref:ABC transporter substrate-binding protein n=1 Tax=Kineococcus sp. SYSU DK003 TaxID=3383124 RepID=UPI003D7D1EA7